MLSLPLGKVKQRRRPRERWVFAGGGGLGGVSSCAATCPPGLDPPHSGSRPSGFFRDRGPTRSLWADVRRGGGEGTPRTGRRGEGAPAWSGSSAASHCAAGRVSLASGWGSVLRCGESEGCAEGRRVEAAPPGSPPRQFCGVPAPPPPRRELPGACGEESPLLPAPRRSLRAGAPSLSSEGARDPPGAASRGPGPADLGCRRGWASDPPPTRGSSSLHPTSFRRCSEVHDWHSGEKQKLVPSQTLTLWTLKEIKSWDLESFLRTSRSCSH